VLEDRRLEVLRAIVEDFVLSNEPVGSKALAERHGLGVSPATVRNDMSALEEEGYITQPHTSAGRIPTDKGYRLFVDRLSGVKPLSRAERRAIQSFLEGAVDLDQREQQWRSDGWTGYDADSNAASASGASASTYPSTGQATANYAATQRDSDIIPVVQEELRVGKRDVNLGRVRVRSYVVEEPVNEQVSLSQERVVLERRPVDRQLSPGDAAFQTGKHDKERRQCAKS